MEFDVLTLFPSLIQAVVGESILGRALDKGLLQVHCHQIRDYALDKHRTTDDLPYGGGPGMVMKCEPLFGAWRAAQDRNPALPARTILLSPQGRPLSQSLLEGWAKELPGQKRLILVCGRYEGIDERFIEECVDEELSLGDFVLTGGEIAALALVDGLARLLPGVLGNDASSTSESFSTAGQGLLEGPQFTRPPEFHGRKVPDILLSGDHAKIAAWRLDQALARTRTRRPDLLQPEQRDNSRKS
jgi:tRNA (guanine37-N1)-methyltransferase